MSLVQRVAGFLGSWRQKSGTSGIVRPEQWLLNALGGSLTSTGLRVSPATAVQCAAVLACVRVLSEDLAKLDLSIYRRGKDGAREEATNHPLHRVLTQRPNSWQSRFEFREMVQGHLCQRGNAYCFIRRDQGGRIRELIPLHPDRVTILEAPDGDLFYQVARSGFHETAQLEGEPITIPGDRILHLRGLSSNGLYGQSIIGMGRESIGLALAMERHGARTFSNGAKPGGVLKSPKVLKPDVVARLRAQFEQMYSGVDNSGRTLLLEEGLDWTQIGMTNEDAQFLAGRQFQVNEIARMFRVPPHKIGDLTRSTNSNIEHQSIEYVTDTLMPWLERWEAALEAQLLTEDEQGKYEIEFDEERILRGDIKSRYEAFAIGRNWGWLSVNDVRRKLGLNPVPNGDVYLQPLNMQPLGSSPTNAPAGGPEPDPGSTPEASSKLNGGLNGRAADPFH